MAACSNSPPPSPAQIPNELLRKLPSACGGVSTVSFSHNGLFLAAALQGAGQVFKLVLHNVLTGSVVMTVPACHHGHVYQLAWSQDDTGLVSASSDGTAKVGICLRACVCMCVGGGGLCVHAYMHMCSLFQSSYSPAKHPRPACLQVLELGYYNSVGKQFPPLVLRHACYIYTACFHPDNHVRTILTAGYDGKIRTWSRKGGLLMETIQVGGWVGEGGDGLLGMDHWGWGGELEDGGCCALFGCTDVL